MDTPKTLTTKGFLILDTSEDNLTGVVIPLCRNNKPMRGTLQMVVEDSGEELDICKDLIHTSPELTPASPYRIKPTVYISSEDRLVSFDRYIGLDGAMAIIALFDEDDLSLKWE